jgi:hypothetical protein
MALRFLQLAPLIVSKVLIVTLASGQKSNMGHRLFQPVVKNHLSWMCVLLDINAIGYVKTIKNETQSGYGDAK